MSAQTPTPRPRRLLVIGAHAADFVWRAAGAIAVTTVGGGSASVLALSYGERGESGELWKEPGQTMERVKQIRHDEASRAAAVLGADFSCLDWATTRSYSMRPRSTG
jgi:4-oxalomesaconate hydratase